MSFYCDVGKKVGSTVKLVRVDDVLILQDFTEAPYLGTELCGNVPLPSTHEAEDMINPATLIAAHNPTMPGIYCVAANQSVIGTKSSTSMSKFTKPPVRVVNELNTPINQVGIVGKSFSYSKLPCDFPPRQHLFSETISFEHLLTPPLPQVQRGSYGDLAKWPSVPLLCWRCGLRD